MTRCKTNKWQWLIDVEFLCSGHCDKLSYYLLYLHKPYEDGIIISPFLGERNKKLETLTANEWRGQDTCLSSPSSSLLSCMYWFSGNSRAWAWNLTQGVRDLALSTPGNHLWALQELCEPIYQLWHRVISNHWSIYTLEMGKFYKSEFFCLFFFFENWFTRTPISKIVLCSTICQSVSSKPSPFKQIWMK